MNVVADEDGNGFFFTRFDICPSLGENTHIAKAAIFGQTYLDHVLVVIDGYS